MNHKPVYRPHWITTLIIVAFWALVCALVMMWAAKAHAQTPPPNTFTLTWTAPLTDADGSSPAHIGGYNVFIADTDAALSALLDTGSASANLISVGNVLTYTTAAFPPGTTKYFAVGTWYCDLISSACQVSVKSVHVHDTIATVTPKPSPSPNVTVRHN